MRKPWHYLLGLVAVFAFGLLFVLLSVLVVRWELGREQRQFVKENQCAQEAPAELEAAKAGQH